MRNNQPVTNVERSYSDAIAIISHTDDKGRITFVNDDFVTHHAIERRADFILRPAEVDERCSMATKGAEFIPQPHINGHAIDALNRWTWGNRQTAFIQPGFYILITKTHGTFSFRASNP